MVNSPKHCFETVIRGKKFGFFNIVQCFALHNMPHNNMECIVQCLLRCVVVVQCVAVVQCFLREQACNMHTA